MQYKTPRGIRQAAAAASWPASKNLPEVLCTAAQCPFCTGSSNPTLAQSIRDGQGDTPATGTERQNPQNILEHFWFHGLWFVLFVLVRFGFLGCFVGFFFSFFGVFFGGLMWETGSLLKVSRKVAALCHNLCTLFSQQIILHLQKHCLLRASVLWLGEEEKSSPDFPGWMWRSEVTENKQISSPC